MITHPPPPAERDRLYWRQTSRLMAGVLVLWAGLSLGLPLLAAPGLDAVQILGFPLGYWLTAQGAVAGFVLLAFWYSHRQNAIDEQFQVSED
jgi:putative solute:sodium symporter small subunit